MINFITEKGISLELIPNQDISFTIENPLLCSDRIPVAWTTDFELASTPANFEHFGYVGAMLLIPSIKCINVECRINGIPIMYGKLKYSGLTENSLSVSFTGVSIEDSLSGKLKDVNMSKWNFGTLENKTEYDSIISDASRGKRGDFALPTIMRKSQLEVDDVYLDIGTPNTKLAYANKYVNSPQGEFIIPVLKLKYIINTILSDCNIDKRFATYIDNIGVVAQYRKNGASDDYEHGCLDKDDDGNYILSLADCLPDVDVLDFMKDALSCLCATIFITRNSQKIISNKTIVEDSNFIDWTSKIDDRYLNDNADLMTYQYGYSSIDEEKEIKGEIIDCETIEQCFNSPTASTVRHKKTQDIYSVVEKHISVGQSAGESTQWRENTLSLVRQGRMFFKEEMDKNSDTYSSVSGFIPVKTIPMKFYIGSGYLKFTSCAVIPVVDFPTVGGSRPSDLYFGLFHDSGIDEFSHQITLSSNGVYNKNNLLSGEWEDGYPALALTDTDGIYELFHKEFAEWIKKDKSPIKGNLNLTVYDIANLELWRKIMLYQQLFFIKNLNITINTSSSIIIADGEFVKA